MVILKRHPMSGYAAMQCHFVSAVHTVRLFRLICKKRSRIEKNFVSRAAFFTSRRKREKKKSFFLDVVKPDSWIFKALEKSNEIFGAVNFLIPSWLCPARKRKQTGQEVKQLFNDVTFVIFAPNLNLIIIWVSRLMAHTGLRHISQPTGIQQLLLSFLADLELPTLRLTLFFFVVVCPGVWAIELLFSERTWLQVLLCQCRDLQ